MDTGFRPAASGSGLFVPEAISREREVWTNAEWKLVKRALTFLGGKHLAVIMRCPMPQCRNTALNTLTQADGSMVLRCEHKDRVIQRG